MTAIERALVERLAAEGWHASPWSNGPDDRYIAHAHGHDKVVVVASGSITFGLPATDDAVHLEVGERLDLPAGTDHDAIVGPLGVTCLEAHRPAGSLTALTRHGAGDW